LSPFVYLVLLTVIALPIAWFISEFSNRRALRIVLGIIAIASTMGVSYIVGHLYEMSYNAWYGSASKDLVDTTISEIEDGKIDRVMKVLRGLDLQYRPTYQNRANYDELVREAVIRMKGNDELEKGKWDVLSFSKDTWRGHWENDTGFWIVISHGLELDIVRSGSSGEKMTDVTLSDDFRKLTFREDQQWLHELTLTNKYEAVHLWRDVAGKSVRDIDTLHKLIRATPSHKEFKKQSQ
jgi:hypothetical protein